MNVPNELFSLYAEEVPKERPDKDPQTLFLQYRTLFEPVAYLPTEVKIEVSALSLKDPYSECSVQSLLFEFYPNDLYSEEPFVVRSVEPRRTFLEKAFLLHEALCRPEKIVMDRKSRHLSDLVAMMDTAHGQAALADLTFYNEVSSHRKIFYVLPGVDYATHAPSLIDFIPKGEVLEKFERDHALMRTQMIYSSSDVSFPHLIERITILQERFRKMER